MQDSSAFQFLAIDTIHESTTNPRRTFEESKLHELAESIRHHGLIQPITVRPHADGFEIVAGARRFRAAQLAELFSVPARIVEIDDAQAQEWQIVENSLRIDVHPYEEATGYQRLLDLPGYDVSTIAERTGKSASHIYARLSLLQLIPAIAEAFTQERITASHANLLARLPREAQAKAYEQCWRKDWQDKEPHLLPARFLTSWIQANLYRNARGSHIYIRPSGAHRFTVLDDLTEGSLARLSAEGFDPCAVIETSPGNFQAWLRHTIVFPKLLGTFAAQTLAARYGADPSAADWRRFGRLPGFNNCKPKHRKPDGFFPFVRLRSQTGRQYPQAEAFEREIATLYQARELEREIQRQQRALSPRSGPGSPSPSLERFRTLAKYRDRPAAADIAFCVAAYATGMEESRIERALEEEYLSRDPSPSRRAAYIRRTMTKARAWVER